MAPFKSATFGLAMALAASPAFSQGSLLDAGKGILKQQMGAPTPATTARGGTLSSGEIGAGLTEALKVGTERVTGLLGRTDAYNRDPAIHIPLPDTLRSAQSALKLAGMSGLADDLELKLNRAAEAAVPKTRQIFANALERMTLDDAKAILNGPEDAATQYFKRTMTPDLKTAIRPVVDSTVAEAGAVKTYESMSKGVPMLGDGRAALTDHVLEYALAGLFHYLAREEAAIRKDPAKRSTELLRKVFAN
ncbi:MAG: DUF4197 domain-containing protein [Solirubrobacterales bacterium]